MWRKGIAMRRKFLIVVGLLVTALPLCVAPLTAQLKPPVLTPPTVPQSAASTPIVAADPLGRETPRGTVLGFIRAAQNENYSEAIQYFQPDRSRRRNSQEDDQEIASQLLTIFNQKFGGLLDTISADPLGRLNDGLPADEEKIGGFPGLSEPFTIDLTRMEDEHGRKIWLFSRKTLNQVPSVYDSLRFPQLEKRLPQSLVSNRFLSMPLWQWIAIPLFVPLALFIARLFSLATHAVRQWNRRRNGKEPLEKERLWRFGPGTLLVAAILHYEFVYLIGTSILYRQYYRRVIFIFLAIALYWVITRVTRATAQRIGTSLANRGMLAERSIVSLVRRFLEITIFLFIAIGVLHSLGLDVTTALAGVGIGGLALGFGAQKTFENLLGGVSILFDKALQVGDTCKIGMQIGTVEDIGLRSTKIRTAERTLLSIPNGTVATATLENYRFREKILCQQILRLRYDMAPGHVRYFLEEIRGLMRRHPKVETDTARVRMVRFAEYALEVELFLYILERDYNQFLEIQEGLLLQVMEILENTGAVVALPSQTTLVAKDSWIDPEKSQAAQAASQKSRDGADVK
jgi:MscS family membrane protein